MAIQKVSINEFLELAKTQPVLDVRSPGEYDHAHIPGAFNLPLFTDEERKIVGTAYKQQSRQQAIKAGLEFFGVKMKRTVEEAEYIVSHFTLGSLNIETPSTNGQEKTRKILIHCWRGGMRSAGVAWLLDLYGFKVYTLSGGYKTYRKWVRDQFEKKYCLNVLGGYTGSGKTSALNTLALQGFPVINLEALANHKGSAFGDLGEMPQPSQEMFENLLAEKIFQLPDFKPAWIEDESRRIGNLTIPPSFWITLRNSPVYFAEVPFEERLNYLTAEYGKFDKEKLLNAVIRIQKGLGGQDAKTAGNFLLENKHRECFSILLKYYDKCYERGLSKRKAAEETAPVKKIYSKTGGDGIARLLSKMNHEANEAPAQKMPLFYKNKTI